MAVILVLVCGFLGFSSAIAGLVFFELTLVQAFGLWMLGGFAAVLLAVMPMLLPRRALAEDRRAETA